MCGSDIFLAILAVFFPPVAVWIKVGICTADSVINLALCCLGYVPGLLHAWYLILKYPEPDYDDPSYEPLPGQGGDAENGRATYYYVSHQPIQHPSQRDYGTVPPQHPQAHAPSPNRQQNDQAAGSSSQDPSDSRPPPTYAEAVKGDHKKVPTRSTQNRGDAIPPAPYDRPTGRPPSLPRRRPNKPTRSTTPNQRLVDDLWPQHAPAMQSMPLLLRQSLRSSLNLSRSTRPVRRPLLPAVGPKALYPPAFPRSFSVCLQCQFRTQSSLYSSPETDPRKEGKPAEQPKDTDPIILPPPEGLQTLETDAGSRPTTPPAAEGGESTQGESQSQSQGQQAEEKGNVNTEGTRTGTGAGTKNGGEGGGWGEGGLPSYLENRRSQFSKQFSTMMDNLQSNVFVAGQRLNDFTGYSGIELLKKDIHVQEERLRNARLQVRTAKDAYAAAINRRSTSQREVNELLQRKHAWSPVDLERFTHLYRNDHTNEVGEMEAQEALTQAEREAEEAAAQLSKSILSRYHEEQVWSDKIRRMSTWGTWGLMGVNVLLFLIFQIAVEPWRRKRLVKGFEEKVIEAIEKEKALGQVQILALRNDMAQHAASTTAATAAAAAAVAPSETLEIENAETTEPSVLSPIPNPAPEPTTEEVVIIQDEPEATTTRETADSPTPTTTTTTPTENKNTLDHILDTYKTQLTHISPSIESCRRYMNDLFSERQVVITQRDLSTVALQGAAAGAAIISLLAVLVRQW
ncbi:hypothetical protein BO70DRAFT_397397 [Aspergillus heteromorphus CBS 117.55]|uniref:Sensitive to high expression protein 9, mitochondrial n=1 Tax=Aspergillus heteromorphus CBS 117.55 TaxID=1448321 RepID=A0A317W061_9EURO|nr:uncharacterized protein BO70DRAFT_397397 [Aspergillus heteromorphus CBS 117.55]PWY79289.1 hypothetical protein BO70DRAFT_397397 [Aspergillus heteromorphus CBS 117.55]